MTRTQWHGRREVKAFSGDAPPHGHVHIAFEVGVGGDVLVGSPTDRHVIEDDVVGSGAPGDDAAIIDLVLPPLPWTYPEVLQQHVVCLNLDTVFPQRDAG